MADKNILYQIGIGIAVIVIANWLIQRPQTPHTPAGYGFMEGYNNNNQYPNYLIRNQT